jgi:hypothetical protein
MSRLWVRLRDALLRSLDPAEREAVSGDFVELAMTDRQVVKSLLGLVMRRQLKLWREWNPWFVLVAIVVPVCPLLETQCNQLGHGIWGVLVTWLHHGPTYYTGVSPAAFWSGVCIRAIALGTWSWTSAFALSTFSRRTIWVTGGLFFSLYVASAIGAVPPFLRIFWLTWWAWLPLLMSFLFVFLPAGCAIHQSNKLQNLKFPWVILLTLWTMTMGGLTLWTQRWGQVAMDNWSRGGSAMTLSQLAHRADLWKAEPTFLLVTAVLTAPIVYVLAKVYIQRAPDRAVTRQG